MQTFLHFHNKQWLYPTCKIRHFFCTYGVIRCKSIGSKDIERLMSFCACWCFFGCCASSSSSSRSICADDSSHKMSKISVSVNDSMIPFFFMQRCSSTYSKIANFASTFWHSIFVSPSCTPLNLHNRGNALIFCIQKAFYDQPYRISDHLLPKFIITLKLPCETWGASFRMFPDESHSNHNKNPTYTMVF